MKMRQVAAGSLVGFGLIFAVLFAAPIPPKWGDFALAVGGMLVGLVWLARLTKQTNRLNGAAGNGTDNVATFLKKTAEQVRRILLNLETTNKQNWSSFRNELTELYVSGFAPISEARDRLIERYGVKRYADFMIPFATAERYFNRGVSAAMDGYWVESIRSLKECLPFLEEAIEKAR